MVQGLSSNHGLGLLQKPGQKRSRTGSYDKNAAKATIPRPETDEITMQVDTKTKVVIRGKSSKVLRVVDLLKNAI